MSVRLLNQVYEWYAMMMGALAAMPIEDRMALQGWEYEHLGSGLATLCRSCNPKKGSSYVE